MKRRSKADRTSVKNKELTFSPGGQKKYHSWVTEKCTSKGPGRFGKILKGWELVGVGGGND